VPQWGQTYSTLSSWRIAVPERAPAGAAQLPDYFRVSPFHGIRSLPLDPRSHKESDAEGPGAARNYKTANIFIFPQLRKSLRFPICSFNLITTGPAWGHGFPYTKSLGIPYAVGQRSADNNLSSHSNRRIHSPKSFGLEGPARCPPTSYPSRKARRFKADRGEESPAQAWSSIFQRNQTRIPLPGWSTPRKRDSGSTGHFSPEARDKWSSLGSWTRNPLSAVRCKRRMGRPNRAPSSKAKPALETV